jgi:hypothetical protein
MAGGVAQIGGEQRKFRFAHALAKDRFAEIKLVIAGRKDVDANAIEKVDDMRALVDARGERGRQRVARMRDDDVLCFCALGLQRGRDPGEAAATVSLGDFVDVAEDDEGQIDDTLGGAGGEDGGFKR